MADRVWLPPIKSLRHCSDGDQAGALDALFEPNADIHTTLLPVVRTAEYGSYREFVEACHIQLLTLAAASTPDAPEPALLSILGSHPRLGVPRVMSPQSAAEQAALREPAAGSDPEDADPEADELAGLNRQYEDRYPGLRYVVFVNGRRRPQIMQDMRARIAAGDYMAEVDAAIQAMCDIAKDRAHKLQAPFHHPQND